MITLKDISFSYQDSAETLFDGFSATLGGTARWTCIAGANGCGKTTLLKLIAGMLVPLSGSIKCGSAVYCAQNSTELPDTAYTLFWDADNEVRRFFSLLNITAKQLERWETLSGGEKKRLQIACALAERPSVLLLDEPTNHLDTDMLEWLETYLLSYDGAILIVSHDRYFLDRVATSVLELENGTTTLYKGNYSRYMSQRNERRKSLQRAYDRQQEKIKETEAYIRKYKAGIKSKQARGRQSQLNRLERIDKLYEGDTLHFDFAPAEECGQKVLVVDDICGGFTDKELFSHLSFLIRRGESAALIGPNGTGKTTLLKMIIGEKEPAQGHITLGSRVHIGYFAQEHTELHSHLTVLEELMADYTMNEEQARSLLGRFLFRGDDVFTSVDSLSGGEQARLALLKLLLSGPNFLILDEPTNHLDIPTREILEDALLDFGGTYLIVSHDRYFLDKITTRTLSLENKQVKDFAGNYSYYKEKEAELLALQAEKEYFKNSVREDKKASTIVTVTVPATDRARKTQPINLKQLEEVEMKIAELEATLKMYEVQMNTASPEALTDLNKAYSETEKALQTAYEKWEKLVQ